MQITSNVFDPDTRTNTQANDTFNALVDAVADPLDVQVRGDGAFEVRFGVGDRGLNTFQLDTIALSVTDNSEIIDFVIIDLNATFSGHRRADGVSATQAGWRVTNPGAEEVSPGRFRVPIDAESTEFTPQVTVDGSNRELPTHRDLTVPVTVQIFSRENEVSDAETVSYTHLTLPTILLV